MLPSKEIHVTKHALVFTIPLEILCEFVQGVPECRLELAKEEMYESAGSCGKEVYH